MVPQKHAGRAIEDRLATGQGTACRLGRFKYVEGLRGRAL